MKMAFKTGHLFSIASVSDKVVAKVLSFAHLPLGWHYGRGGPATESTVRRALATREFLMTQGANSIEAFLREDRSIVISAFNEADQVDVTVAKSGSYDIFVERNEDTLLDEEGLDFSKVAAYVRFLGWKETLRSGSSTRAISRTRRVALIAPQFSHRTMELPLLMKLAPFEHRNAPAHMLQYSTQSASPVGHRFSSGSTSARSQSTPSPKIRLRPATSVTS
jgi:hypothetical protein